MTTPEKENHTPTPWEFRDENGYFGIDTGNPKEQIAGTSFDGLLDLANAEFIVEAVNVYATHKEVIRELVESCQVLLREYTAGECHCKANTCCGVRSANAAISKAEKLL